MNPIIEFKLDSINDQLLEQEFLTKENEMQELSKKIFNAKSYNEIKNLCGESKVFLLNYALDDFIANATIYPRDSKILKAQAERLKKASGGWLEHINLGENRVDFLAQDDKFYMESLSKKFPAVKEFFPDIETEERYGACHDNAIRLAIKAKDNCEVVTGFVSPLTDKVQYLHSWVEVQTKDGEMVMDPSRNLYMAKKDYYEIRDVQGDVYKIPNTTIREDVMLLDYLKEQNWLYLKLYLSNRPLAIKVYEKLKAQEKEN